MYKGGREGWTGGVVDCEKTFKSVLADTSILNFYMVHIIEVLLQRQMSALIHVLCMIN